MSNTKTTTKSPEAAAKASAEAAAEPAEANTQADQPNTQAARPVESAQDMAMRQATAKPDPTATANQHIYETPGPGVIDAGTDEIDRALERAQAWGFDPTTLENADPAYRYKFVAKKPDRIARHRARGYVFVTHEDTVKLTVQTSVGQGAREFGDLVLMKIPRRLYETRVKRIEERHDRRMRDASEGTRERVNKLARDGGVSGPHQDIVVDTSEVGETRVGERIAALG